MDVGRCVGICGFEGELKSFTLLISSGYYFLLSSSELTFEM